MDSLTRLQAGIDHARPIIAATTRDDYARPTPCEAWTVRELINHMLGALTISRDVAVDGAANPAVSRRTSLATRPSRHSTGSAPKRWPAGKRTGAWTERRSFPGGEFPAAFALQFPAMDMLVHGWDLARATGQQHQCEDELVLDNLTFAQSTLASPDRAGFYGAPIDVADDAPAIDRLVAFLGRRPA